MRYCKIPLAYIGCIHGRGSQKFAHTDCRSPMPCGAIEEVHVACPYKVGDRVVVEKPIRIPTILDIK